MRLSDFSILSPEFVWRDEKSKSLSYFSKLPTVFCSTKIVGESKEISAPNENANARICLHSSPDDSLQNMVLIARMGIYNQPHKHEHKTESYHIIEGGLAYFEFDLVGNIIEIQELAVGDILRVGKNITHVTLPLVDPSVFHETAIGPFDPQLNMVVPEWVPEKGDKERTDAFLKKLITAIPSCQNNTSVMNAMLSSYNLTISNMAK